MFNFAGILIVGEAFDMKIEDWSRIFDVNLKGVGRNQKIMIFPFYARLFTEFTLFYQSKNLV